MIERTEDVDFIRSVITHPRIWPWVSEDGQQPEDYEPLIHPLVHYLRSGDDGVVEFRAMGVAIYQGHVAMLPGVRSDDFARAAVQWMWDNTSAQKLYCQVPARNRHAVAYVRRAGFAPEGRLTDAYLKNGKLHDLIVMGVSKCQAQ